MTLSRQAVGRGPLSQTLSPPRRGLCTLFPTVRCSAMDVAASHCSPGSMRSLHGLGSSWSIAPWGTMLRSEQAWWNVPQACLHSDVWDLEPVCYTPSHHVDHMVVTQPHTDEGAISLQVLRCTNKYTSLHSLQHACGVGCSCLFAGRGTSYFFYSLASISAKCVGALHIKPAAMDIAQTQRRCISKSS